MMTTIYRVWHGEGHSEEHGEELHGGCYMVGIVSNGAKFKQR